LEAGAFQKKKAKRSTHEPYAGRTEEATKKEGVVHEV